MRILIVGGSGFIGGSLAKFLKSREHQVIVSGFSREADIKVDARSINSLAEFFKTQSFDLVVNLAGSFRDNLDVNICSSMNIVRAMFISGKTARFIHVASSTEKSTPKGAHESEYSLTKEIGTMNFQSSLENTGFCGMTITLHNTYGLNQPSDRFITACLRSLLNGQEIRLKYPNRVRDFVYQPDVNLAFVRAISDLITNPDEAIKGKEIGTGIGHTLQEAASIIAEELDGDSSLIKTFDSLSEDPHPIRIAPVAPLKSYLCTTTLREGIQRIMGARL